MSLVSKQQNRNKDRLALRVKLQTKQIELLRNKVFLLHEALVRTNGLPVCDLGHSLSPITPVVTRLLPNAENTVIVFGGMLTKLGMPPAEFLRTFIDKDINIIFLKDFYQCWYQRGLLGLSSSIEETVDVIKKIIPINQKTICTVGTSSGGFAAILFGVLLNVHKVIAFGPQVNVTEKVFKQFKSIDSRLNEIDLNSPFLNLKNLLESIPSDTSIHIHFAKNHKNDQISAESLAHLPNVSLHGWETDNHNIAGWLKRENRLNPVLDELFANNKLKRNGLVVNKY